MIEFQARLALQLTECSTPTFIMYVLISHRGPISLLLMNLLTSTICRLLTTTLGASRLYLRTAILQINGGELCPLRLSPFYKTTFSASHRSSILTIPANGT